MFRRVLRANIIVIIVVYVDDLLVASETKRDEEQAINDLRSCFSIKDLGKAGLYLGCHIPRDRDAGTLKFDQHHYGSSGSKIPAQGRCLTGRGGDGRNACCPLLGGGRGPHVSCALDLP